MLLFFILAAIFAIGTLGILLAGGVTVAKGGDFNRKYGNRLMQARVACQALAIICLLLATATA
jgi:sulfite exporter TauE/SafE